MFKCLSFLIFFYLIPIQSQAEVLIQEASEKELFPGEIGGIVEVSYYPFEHIQTDKSFDIFIKDQSSKQKKNTRAT